MTNTRTAIEIFDQATHTRVAACAQGGQCIVAFAAAPSVHKFVAFIAPPTAEMPPSSSAISSNVVSVNWIGLKLDATNGAVVGPGKLMMVTATSTINVEQTGYVIEIFDTVTKSRLTYCTRGTTCSISLSQPAAGSRTLVAELAKPTSTFTPTDAVAVSPAISVTWVAVSISGYTTGQVGATVYLNATVNADVSNSPWSIGIFDEQGHLVAPPCKTGASCYAQVSLTTPTTPHYSAAIGSVPPEANTKLSQLLQKVTGPAQLVNIQARSAAMEPMRTLWGVDSCKSFASDPSGTGLLQGVIGWLGQPDFWGRYLTNTVCPGLSGTEIAAAHNYHIGILPIYNDYVCSNVVGYDTGRAYASGATAAAETLGIPSGRILAIDIEPPGDACPGAANVDAGFVAGWFDGVTSAHYVPAYYANGTPGKEFAGAWCGAVSDRPEIASISFLWSFQPSLLGNYGRGGSPGFGPFDTGCGGNLAAWQYQIGSDSATPDVDQDEVLSVMPLWYP